ncbi:MAG: glutamate--tRNA ligase [Rhodospirillales bacterium]|nr:glutamate--tRNA ligase [Rhodospirillales bacterium]
MSTKVRFAPSPTGLLHVGNARTALVNALFARAGGGHFLLRFDDTDRERSKDEYAAAIEEDLRWMGLAWDSSARQRDRLPAYEEAFARLRVADRVYPCWETPEELEYKRKRQLARGHPPIYDRAALRLTDGERRRLEEDGRRPHWRFMLQPGFVGWNDMVRGRVEMQADHMSDPVVVRADGTFLYMLPSAIDDIDLGITHVIRGEDHVANTAVQIQMFQALEAEPPAFAHLPKVADIAGKELSKRLGSMTVRSLRGDGIEPLALASYLARLGTGDPAQAAPSLAALAAEFDIARYGRATPKFDESQLVQLNAQVLHASAWETVAPRLAALGMTHADAAFWQAVRGNLNRLEDARPWHDVCYGEITPGIVDATFAAIAASLLPPAPWDESTWQGWTQALRDTTARKGKELFLPLRLALTGREHGPELRALLPLMGRSRVVQRLREAARAPSPVDLGQ